MMAVAADRQDLPLSQLQYQQPEKCSRESLQKPASSLQPSPTNHSSPYWQVRLSSHGTSPPANGGRIAAWKLIYAFICQPKQKEGVGWSSGFPLSCTFLTAKNLLSDASLLPHCPSALPLSHCKHTVSILPAITSTRQPSSAAFYFSMYWVPPAGKTTVWRSKVGPSLHKILITSSCFLQSCFTVQCFGYWQKQELS